MTSLRRCALLALLITFCTTGIASAAGCRIERYPEIPVTLKDMQSLIHVKLNGQPALLAVDSGAFFSVLSPEGARRYHLTHLFAPPGMFLGGVGGNTQPQLVSARTFTFVNQTLHHVEFLVAGNDYFSHASGVLGDNFLRVADLDLNLGKGYMRFVRTAHCGNLPLAYWAGRRPVGMVRFNPPAGGAPRFVATARLDGHRIHVLFDTGAARSVLSLATAERLHLGPGDPGVQPAGRAMGFSHRMVKAWIAPVARLQIGGETIEHTHIEVIPMTTLGPNTGLVLGADFFLAHHVYIANRQHEIYFTYRGGPVFALGEPGPAGAAPRLTEASAAGLTAADWIRRGMAARAREQYPQALADFKHGCALAPTDARCFTYQGQTALAAQQPALALASFQHAVRLQPHHYPQLLGVAAARLALRRNVSAARWTTLTAGATRALGEASRVTPADSVAQLMLGTLSNEAGAFTLARDAFRSWLRYHGEDATAPYARTGLCWANAAANRHLHRALRECAQALEGVPGATFVLNSRGLADLRLGHWKAALRDYEAALKRHPHRPLPLYGRGLVELHLGQRAAAQADFAAAAKADPDTARRYAQIGLVP
ncbi:MAG: aspartyl protease family protein [Gammaproteobacteria bacterium]|nr:aspartyl protease family protein [Gammaproteobacteria bacterium]